MDWGKYLFYRFNAASGINMKEMSVHLKPLIWNVPLLSCATEPHFCCSLSQLSQKRSALNAIVHFFSWGWKQSSCKRHFHIHPLPATKGSEAFAPCLCEMLHIPECFFAIWNHIHKCEFVFLRCWGDGPLGAIRFSCMFSELVCPFEGLFISPICWQQEAAVLWNSYSEGIDCCVLATFYSHFLLHQFASLNAHISRQAVLIQRSL